MIKLKQHLVDILILQVLHNARKGIVSKKIWMHQLHRLIKIHEYYEKIETA